MAGYSLNIEKKEVIYLTAIFKKTTSPSNKCAKVFASGTQSFDVYFLEETSITTPSIVLVAKLDTIAQYNYCEISQLKRKYFIRDITSLDGERVRVDLVVDVLASFYDDVISAQVLVERSSANKNVFIPDGKLKNSARGIPQIKSFSGGEWLPTLTTTTNGIVITTFGGGV